MKVYNRILLQLDTAINLANSDLPQKKAMAVILFDNIIEYQIYERVTHSLWWDETSWISGNRKHSKKEREEIVGPKGKYDRMLKFASDKKIISNEELEIIKFAHEIRNGVYHRGEDEKAKLDLAILVYYGFIVKNFTQWGSPRGMTRISSLPEDQQIDFGQGAIVKSKASLDTKNYFKTALSAILSKWRLTTNLAEKANESINEQLNNIRHWLEYIESETGSLNYYGALEHYWYLNDSFSKNVAKGRKPKNKDRILLLSLYLREYKDYLDDLPSLEERQKEGRKLLRSFEKKHKGEYPFWVNLNNIEQRIKTLNGKNEHTIIKNILDIQNKINNLYLDTELAAKNLDWYIDFLIDIRRELKSSRSGI